MLMANQSISRNFDYYDLGLIDYKKAWDLQNEIYNKRLHNEVNDTLLLLEHPHTYTLGKVAAKENLLSNDDQLKQLGISVYEIDRGGDITYHGPGQIVGYPIINLSEWNEDTHKYLRGLEEVLMQTCSEYGLESERNSKFTGVWLKDRKIAAIGIKVSRWITMHGFAFNVNTNLSYFDGIIPCGIKDKEVTSLSRELGKNIDLNEVKKVITEKFKEIFGYDSFTELSKEKYLSEVVPS
jgi:lipoyl(octanoyl) transferase